MCQSDMEKLRSQLNNRKQVKEDVLLCQKKMFAQLQTILNQMLTKSEVPKDIKKGTETDFGVSC